MGLSDQLTFYDLVGLIIPGGAVLAPVAWALLTLGWVDWPSLDPLMLAGAGLGAAYVLGHLAQLITRLPRVDRLIEGRDGHPYEETLLDPTTTRAPSKEASLPGPGADESGPGGLSRAFHDRLSWGLERTLGIKPELATPAGRREAFGLCYAYVVQYGNPGRIQMFKGVSGFYRGMLTAATVTVIAGATAAGVLLGRTASEAGPGFALVAAAGLTVLGAVAAGLFVRGFHQMDRRFVLAVLRSFYVLACADRTHGAAGAVTPRALLEPQEA